MVKREAYAGSGFDFLVESFVGIGGSQSALLGKWQGEDGEALGHIFLHMWVFLLVAFKLYSNRKPHRPALASFALASSGSDCALFAQAQFTEKTLRPPFYGLIFSLKPSLALIYPLTCRDRHHRLAAGLVKNFELPEHSLHCNKPRNLLRLTAANCLRQVDD